MGAEPDAEEGEVTRPPRRSDRWSRTALTALLELTAMTLAGLVILVLAQRVLCDCGWAYFRPENDVGVRIWFLSVSTISPFRSVFSRTASHAGSLSKADHFVSRSASESHESR
jgi:hypothetical protein